MNFSTGTYITWYLETELITVYPTTIFLLNRHRWLTSLPLTDSLAFIFLIPILEWSFSLFLVFTVHVQYLVKLFQFLVFSLRLDFFPPLPLFLPFLHIFLCRYISSEAQVIVILAFQFPYSQDPHLVCFQDCPPQTPFFLCFISQDKIIFTSGNSYQSSDRTLSSITLSSYLICLSPISV